MDSNVQKPLSKFSPGAVKKNLPQDIQEKGKFCYWSYGIRKKDKWTKVPYFYDGHYADVSNPGKWMNLDEAISARKKRSGDGIGILLYGDIAGIDIDHCIDEAGHLNETAEEIVLAMNSYTEKSPSGTGVHILFRIDNQKFSFDKERYYKKHDDIEVYNCSWSNRYLTVTGEKLELDRREYPDFFGEYGDRTKEFQSVIDGFMLRSDQERKNCDSSNSSICATNALLASSENQQFGPTRTEFSSPSGNVEETNTEERRPAPQQTSSSPVLVKPQQIISSGLTDDQIIQKAMTANDGGNFKDLWNGSIGAYNNDDSRADLALCKALAFWTKDRNQIDRLFRQSGLYNCPDLEKRRERQAKWNRKDYGPVTIDKAIAYQQKSWSPDFRSSPPPSSRKSPAVRSDGTVDYSGTGMTEKEIEEDLINRQIEAEAKQTKQRKKSETSAPSLRSESTPSGFAEFQPIDTTEISLPEFPINFLPPIAADMARAISESAKVNYHISCNIVISAIGIVSNGNYRLQIPKGETVAAGTGTGKGSWFETPNLYILISAVSGEHKSAALSIITDHIQEKASKYNDSIKSDLAKALQNLSYMQKRKAALEAEAAKVKTDHDEALAYLAEAIDLDKDISEIKIPVSARITVSDTTVEGLAPLMKDHHERISEVATEGQFIKNMSGAYSTNEKNSNTDLIKHAYKGEPYEVDRKGSPSILLKSPYLSILLVVQPEIQKRMMENEQFAGEGINQRFIFVQADQKSEIGTRKLEENKEIPEEINNRFWNALDGLLEEQFTPPAEPITVRMSEEAYKELCWYYSEFCEPKVKQYNDDRQPQLAQWTSRLHGLAARAALCIHLFNHGTAAGNRDLTEDEMKAGMTISYYWYLHTVAAYQNFGYQLPHEDGEALTVWKYILTLYKESQKDSFTIAELHSKARGRYPHRSDMKEGLNALVTRGYIRIEKIKAEKAGRPSEIIHINPEAIQQ